MDEQLRREIESLRKLTLRELKQRYRDLTGEEPTTSHHQQLFRRLAWRLQAMREGDLSQRARQKAMELAQDVELRVLAPRRFTQELKLIHGGGLERDRRLPVPGTVVERNYRGAVVKVTIGKQEFVYEGKAYPSLSAVAQKATGTRWNGFTFFNLVKPAKEKA